MYLTEEPSIRPDSDPPKSKGWPSRGTIEFRNYRVRRLFGQIEMMWLCCEVK